MTTQIEPQSPPVRGYYSLIQFCPDTARLETANVGVVLYCEPQRYLRTHISGQNQRIIQMFGRGEQDLHRLRAIKRSLRETLESQRDELFSLEQLQKLAALHVNHLRMTPFMPCRIVGSPDEELQRLYQELVGARSAEDVEPVSSVTTVLESVFARPAVSPFIRRGIDIEVPIFQTRETIPYAFQNGRLNLIKPIEFPRRFGSVIDKAARNAIEGQSIFDHPHDHWGPLQLVVVGSFPRTKASDVTTVQRIFEENQVRLFTLDQIDELESEIVTDGHPINA